METTTNHSALLVMDFQTEILKMLGEPAELLDKVKMALKGARDMGIPIIYVKAGFRPGAPEMNIHGKGNASVGGRARWTPEFVEAFMQVHPDIAPQEGDLVVTKRRVSAFSGSDLEILLRAMNIRHLILSGIATSGVVLSTVREAADKDFFLTVLSDACMDRDEEVHQVLMTKIFPRQVDVTTVGEWIAQ
jgi:nicotinamidase-related amidase